MLGVGILVVALVQEVWYMCAPPLGGGGVSGPGTSQSKETESEGKNETDAYSTTPCLWAPNSRLGFFHTADRGSRLAFTATDTLLRSVSRESTFSFSSTFYYSLYHAHRPPTQRRRLFPAAITMDRRWIFLLLCALALVLVVHAQDADSSLDAIANADGYDPSDQYALFSTPVDPSYSFPSQFFCQ